MGHIWQHCEKHNVDYPFVKGRGGECPKCEQERKQPQIASELNLIIAFESGELEPDKVLELFSMLIKNGRAWTLQGMYGRTAMQFINAGYLDRNGNILRHFEEDEA